MASNRSYKNYVSVKFEDELFAAIESFIEENKHNIDFWLYRVQNIGEIYFSDIEVQYVYVNDMPGTKLEFDATIIVDLEIFDTNHRKDESENIQQWFLVSCIGDIETRFEDFEIVNITEYNGKDKKDNPLSDALVPIINKNQLDSVARVFLEKYYPEALKMPMAIETKELAKRMDLSVEMKEITEDLSVFGQIFFKDSNSEFYDSEKEEVYEQNVSAKTIFVDPKAFFLRNLGSVNNTIVHECVHWELHRLAFELERLYDEDLTAIRCKVIGGIEGTDKQSTNWMEWQSNALAPRIQMPLAMFKTKAFNLIKYYREKLNTSEIIDVLEVVIDELATHFVVSREAAKIRLIDVGYEEAVGVYNYIDGKYIPPYLVKQESLSRNQTFSVSFIDVIIQSATKPELRELVGNGSYLYVESHLCVNSPKYITYDMFGTPTLTRYARLNMDECCVVFDLALDVKNGYGKQYYTECVLYKNAEGINFIVSFNSESNVDVQQKATLITKHNSELIELMKILSSHFPKALEQLIEWRGISQEKLADDCLMNSKTISRILNVDGYNTSLEIVIALCIGLQLPPPVNKKLIEIAGYSLRYTDDKHMAYDFILNGCYTYSIHECNELLVNSGFKVLTNKE